MLPPALSHTPRCALQQMDNAVYTFETLLHQELGKGPTKEELCKSIQRILERVLKVRHHCPLPPPPAQMGISRLRSDPGLPSP